MCACGSSWVPGACSRFPGTGITDTISHYAGAENQTWVLLKSSHAPYHGASNSSQIFTIISNLPAELLEVLLLNNNHLVDKSLRGKVIWILICKCQEATSPNINQYTMHGGAQL